MFVELKLGLFLVLSSDRILSTDATVVCSDPYVEILGSNLSTSSRPENQFNPVLHSLLFVIKNCFKKYNSFIICTILFFIEPGFAKLLSFCRIH